MALFALKIVPISHCILLHLASCSKWLNGGLFRSQKKPSMAQILPLCATITKNFNELTWSDPDQCSHRGPRAH
jgi:hypothetical protein